jgi:hypothetical protein
MDVRAMGSARRTMAEAACQPLQATKVSVSGGGKELLTEEKKLYGGKVVWAARGTLLG